MLTTELTAFNFTAKLLITYPSYSTTSRLANYHDEKRKRAGLSCIYTNLDLSVGQPPLILLKRLN